MEKKNRGGGEDKGNTQPKIWRQMLCMIDINKRGGELLPLPPSLAQKLTPFHPLTPSHIVLLKPPTTFPHSLPPSAPHLSLLLSLTFSSAHPLLFNSIRRQSHWSQSFFSSYGNQATKGLNGEWLIRKTWGCLSA